jgi:alpha-glucoside transport system permease protein
VLRIVGALVVPIAAFALLWLAFDFLRDADANRFVLVGVAIVVGVGGVFFLYWAMNRAVDWLPERYRGGVRPYVFVGPALVILAVFLVYPVINTIIISFGGRQPGSGFVGFDNYEFVFTDDSMRRALRNTLGWIVFVPVVATSIGLAFATLADRLRRGEAVAKSLIFLPMAISFVGASIVWRFVYNFRPEGFGEQTGLLNGIWTGLGQEPVAWLLQEPWNNLYLMVIMIWLYTGFAMVILSSAIKGVPEDMLEAARVDGANEWQIFWRITLPTIASTVVVVLTTILITVWKVFDIVFVMTGGEFGTTIVAERMITEFFTFRHSGRGAAFAVLLFVAVVPVMIVNIRRFRAQEQMR